MGFGAGCLIVHDWHVLLGLRAGGERCPMTWAAFGGGADPGETAVECMLREVLEESGIRLDPSRCAFLCSQRGGRNYAFHTFVAFPRECPVATLSGESLDAAWFPLGGSPGTLWSMLPPRLHPGLRALAGSPAASAALLALRGGGPRPASRAPVVPATRVPA